MTDITELAQSLKAAAPNVTSGPWVVKDYFWLTPESEVFSGEFVECHNGPDAQYLKLLSPENILALLEALEKAQQVDEELCKLLPPGAEYMDPPDGGDVTPLEGVRRMVADYRQRIAELESRTVKMPHRNLGHPKLFLLCPFPYYDAEDMEKALAAAGIRVEAE
ncbi:TPA: ead/Ea22-like family protein [Klebsiella quasipneumoniae subsp. similipneumoniae]